MMLPYVTTKFLMELEAIKINVSHHCSFHIESFDGLIVKLKGFNPILISRTSNGSPSLKEELPPLSEM
jgi:hypothetical protein